MKTFTTIIVVLFTGTLIAAEPEWLTTGQFAWKSSKPVISPEERTDDPCFSVKDPTVVFHGGKYHIFMTIRSEKRTHQIEYVSFADWKNADKAERHILKMHPGYFCAPQVFYFSPQTKWYLICQASDPAWKEETGAEFGAAFSTTDDISRPDSWSPLKPLGAKRVGENAGLDFWVICDAEKAYLFFTTLDGRMWREETTLGAFPKGWSEPELALHDDVFEASHTYKIKGSGKYLTVIEAQGGPAWRYYKAYLADSPDGVWKPLAATREKNFAGKNNVKFPAGGVWADSISHVELIRAGFDERLEIDPENLTLLYQGVLDGDTSGKVYGQIPWRLGLLKFFKPAENFFKPAENISTDDAARGFSPGKRASSMRNIGTGLGTRVSRPHSSAGRT